MEMDSKIWDLVVVGGGPAGLSALLYGSRLGAKTLLLERLAPGGAITLSSEIENYPGVCQVKDGLSFMECWQEQATRFGGKIEIGEVTKIEPIWEVKDNLELNSKTTPKAETISTKTIPVRNKKKFNHSISDIRNEKVPKGFRLFAGEKEYLARVVIVATGSSHRKAGFKGEEEFTGKGVSYCAVCDGFFYKGKEVGVIGGGDTALEEALYLSKIARKVFLIHRRDKFRAAPATQKRVFNTPNIQILFNSVVKRVEGKLFVERLVIERDGKEITLPLPGVFVFVGMVPNSQLVKGLVELNQFGEIKVNLKMETSMPGIYAVGDVRENSQKQVVIAAGDGATAAINGVKFIESNQ